MDKLQQFVEEMQYLAAGFEEDGETEGGLLAVRLRPENMPGAEKPWESELFQNAG